MSNIILFTQNTKLDTLVKSLTNKGLSNNLVLVTTNLLFENEKELLLKHFENSKFLTFSDLTGDSVSARIDDEAYEIASSKYAYYENQIRILKNKYVIKSLKECYTFDKCFFASSYNDLGIYDQIWLHEGFKRLDVSFYYKDHPHNSIRLFFSQNKLLRTLYHTLKGTPPYPLLTPDEVHVSSFNGKKLVFIGKMHRINYRLNIPFEDSEKECEKLNIREFESSDTCTYLTTIHERALCNIPDDDRYSVYYMQDGYLPPNFTSNMYAFIPNNVKYYAWDILGTEFFRYKKLPVEIIPFRKKIYLEEPTFPKEVKNILVVASGSGDWTALKNRSDDDALVATFAEFAKRNPDIDVTYRCHPTWIHHKNVGVNSIRRVADYFEYLDLPNLHLSSNIPQFEDASGKSQYSYKRSSLEEDLKSADLVFGEHSISMIDAAMDKMPFCSVNMTGRRDFYIGITRLGFPHCESIEEIEAVIKNIPSSTFQESYINAIKKYNEMTDEELIS